MRLYKQCIKKAMFIWRRNLLTFQVLCLNHRCFAAWEILFPIQSNHQKGGTAFTVNHEMLRRAASGQWLTCINERGDVSWTFIQVLGKHLLLRQEQSTKEILIATPFALRMVFPCVLPNTQNWRAKSVVHSRTDPTNGCLPSTLFLIKLSSSFPYHDTIFLWYIAEGWKRVRLFVNETGRGCILLPGFSFLRKSSTSSSRHSQIIQLHSI